MKRLLAMTGLLLLCAGPVTADYLFVKIDLNKVNFDGAAASGQPGIGGPGGGIQGPGGLQPGGAQPGGLQPGGVGAGAFGGKGAVGGKGMPGGGKGMMPGGGKGMMPGGLGAAPGGLGAAPGGLGAGPGGIGAAPGGLGVGPGGVGGPPNAAGFGPGAAAESSEPPQYVVACFDMRTKWTMLPQLPVFEFDHRFGKKGRFLTAEIVKDLVEYKFVEQSSNVRDYGKKYSKVVLDAKDASGCYLAAAFALSHGMTSQFHAAMAALTKADGKHYAAVNYARLVADLKKAPSSDDATTLALINDLKTDGGFKLITSSAGHYVLLTRNDSAQFQAANKRRLDRLEESFDNFFYWFALQETGPQPNVPKVRLYAVLVDDRQSFFDRHASWGGQPMVADSFTPRRDNLIVLSSKRLDDDFTLFDKKMQGLMQTVAVGLKIGRDDFISGAVWDRKDANGQIGGLAAVQTLMLVHKALEDEAERAAISHEAARQLLFASGMLPRLVNVPEWTQSGLASYFDTPYGAMYPGVGLPSWSHLIAFRHYRKSKEKLGPSHDALLRTISDRYFRNLRTAEEDHKPVSSDKDKKDEKYDPAREQREIAQSSAWALTYYLMYNKKLPQLARYTQELANLPRDLELDDKVLQACFGRAFDLMDPKDPRRLDVTKARLFASDWYSFMDSVNLEVKAAEDIYRDVRFTTVKKSVNQYNQPSIGPGGIGVPGGGLVPGGPGLNPGGLNPPGIAPPGGLLKPGGAGK